MCVRRRRSKQVAFGGVYVNQGVTFSTLNKDESNYAVVTNGNAQAPVISSESLLITSYEGTTAVLPCDACGEPTPVIKWLFNGKHVPGTDKRLVVLGDKSLQISNVQASDSGKYKCVATNIAGSDEQLVKLIVQATRDSVKTSKDTSGDFYDLLYMHD